MFRYLDIGLGLLMFSSTISLIYAGYAESKTWLVVYTSGISKIADSLLLSLPSCPSVITAEQFITIFHMQSFSTTEFYSTLGVP